MKNILDFITTKFKTYDVFELCGIPIKFNLSFPLIGLLVFFGSGNICLALAAVFSLAISLLAHELGHCLMAKTYGYNTHDITMTILGGCASLDLHSKPLDPNKELKIAIAGPCVSFVLGIGSFICLAILVCIGSIAPLLSTMLYPLTMFFACMMWLNMVLGFFNLVPAFPMDGGRVLRAWLAKKKSRIAATETAIKVAKVIACIFGGLAVVSVLSGNIGGITLGLVAFFVWNAGEIELQNEKMAAAYGRP